MDHLVIQSGKHRGKKLVLPDKEVIIGRDETCDIQLGSTDVSRQHCALRPNPQGLSVRDLGSRNGTLVNNVVITAETVLREGDVLQVGPMVFRIPAAKPAVKEAGVKPSVAKPSNTSDDRIADWLTGDESESAGPGDTTIVPRQKAEEPQPREAPQPTTPPKVPGKQFNSVAEEAADIIRRHWESEGRGQPG